MPLTPPPPPSPAPQHRGVAAAGRWALHPRLHRPLSLLPKRNRPGPHGGRPRPRGAWAAKPAGHRQPATRLAGAALGREQVTPPPMTLRKDFCGGGLAGGGKSFLGRTRVAPAPRPACPHWNAGLAGVCLTPGPCSPWTPPVRCQPRPCLPWALGRAQQTALLMAFACYPCTLSSQGTGHRG